MGTPQAAVPTLQRCVTDGHEVVAVWTQPDRPSGRGHRVSFSPVKEFALAHGLPIHQPARIKNDEAIDLFTSHNADLAVVVAGRILPDQFLLLVAAVSTFTFRCCRCTAVLRRQIGPSSMARLKRV